MRRHDNFMNPINTPLHTHKKMTMMEKSNFILIKSSNEAVNDDAIFSVNKV